MTQRKEKKSVIVSLSEGAFHLSELTRQTIPVVTFNKKFLTLSVKSWVVCTKGMVFQQKRLEQACFIFQMIGQAMVRPGQSIGKRPLNNPIM